MFDEGFKRYVPQNYTEITHGIFICSCAKLSIGSDFNAGIGLVQMMGMTNYLALVGGGKSPKFAMNKVRLARVEHRPESYASRSNSVSGRHLGRHEREDCS